MGLFLRQAQDKSAKLSSGVDGVLNAICIAIESNVFILDQTSCRRIVFW
jgi:hypothetical protein